MDSSGSIGASNFQMFLKFMTGIVQRFKIGPKDIQVGLATFNHRYTDRWSLNKFSDQASLVKVTALNLDCFFVSKTLTLSFFKAITSLDYTRGGTKTGNAIAALARGKFTEAQGRRKDIPAVTVVITDGRSYDSVSSSSLELRKKSSVNIHAASMMKYVLSRLAFRYWHWVLKMRGNLNWMQWLRHL